MDQFDGIVIGAGHNGLITGAYMARSGLKVAVVERNPEIGGGCSTEEPTLPGFRHNLHANFFVGWDDAPPYRDLELHKYGFAIIVPPVQNAIAFRDGAAITIHRDLEQTVKSIARISERDAKTYRELYQKFAGPLYGLITSLLYSPPLRPDEVRQRLTGPLAEELLAYSQMGLNEAVDRNFEGEQMRVFFKLFLHAYTLEEGPGAGLFFPRIFSRINHLTLPVGGADSLPRALARLIRDHDGVILTGKEVRRIVVRDGEARGVELDDGATLEARRFVASGIDAPQTIRLAGEENFDRDIVDKMHKWQWATHSLVIIHLALNEAPRYKAAEFDPAINEALNIFIGADNGREIEEHWREVHAGQFPSKPMGNGACDTLFDPTYAPAGKHMAFWWPFAPFELKDGARGWDDRKEEFTQRLVDVWRDYAPNLTEKNILATYLFTPPDIERHVVNMVRGNHHVGAYTMDQLGYQRPHPALSHYRTPLRGLYLCGSSSHPGGSVSGAPGYNAANVIAQDLGLKRWWQPVPPPHLEG